VAAKRRRTGEVRRRAAKGWYEVSGPLPLWIGQGQLKNTVAPVRGGEWRLVEQDGGARKSVNLRLIWQHSERSGRMGE
jgi:hypothetical protein